MEKKQQYGVVKERLMELLQVHGSIAAIPEEKLLSISLEDLNKTTQRGRDRYFELLIRRYGSIDRVPVEEIASQSRVILIRGESKRGPYLVLGRIDGETQRVGGYGKRYFFDEHE